MVEHLHFYPDQKKTLSFRPRIVFSGTLKGEENWQNSAHRHDFCEIMFVTAGEGVIIIENKSYYIKTGDIVVYNIGVFHEERCTGAALSILFFSVDNLRIPGLPEGCIVPKDACPVIGSGSYDEVLKTFLTLMVDELDRKDKYYKAISTNIATMVCYYILRLYGVKVESPENADICRRAKAYIEENYRREMNLDTFANSVHMSKYHFIRIFKETTGVSPMKHLLSVRLSAAKELLSRTDLSVQEIAKEVGYENALTFSRVFKNSEDIAPSEYRKKIKSYAITE